VIHQSYGFCPQEDCDAEKEPQPEEIVAKLRQVAVLISQGQSVAEATARSGFSDILWARIFTNACGFEGYR
jgi:hypothetical protein